MNDLIYICSYFLSFIFLYLFMQDFKKFKKINYNEISNDVWIKIYCIISISFIHLIWLFSIFILNDENTNYIYGLPIYLLLPYILYIISDFKQYDSIISVKLNKYFNLLMSVYLIGIIVILIIPIKNKKNIITYLKNILNPYLH